MNELNLTLMLLVFVYNTKSYLLVYANQDTPQDFGTSKVHSLVYLGSLVGVSDRLFEMFSNVSKTLALFLSVVLLREHGDYSKGEFVARALVFLKFKH